MEKSKRTKLTNGKGKKKIMWFWRSFDKDLADRNMLQDSGEQPESTVRESFLRKLLYGNFDSGVQVQETARQLGISLEDSFFCVVTVEYEDPYRAGLECSRDEFMAVIREFLSRYLPWSYWRYQVSELSYVVLLKSSSLVQEKAVKEALERMNYEFYSRYMVRCYMGVSCTVKEPLEISRQYEIALRISEFARYRGIRVPVIPQELPQNQLADQPLFFSIDMELKLVNLIRYGDDEQLEDIISQIRSVYFRPENSPYISHYTIEILRGCVFRSVSKEDDSPEARHLRSCAQKACQEEQIFDLLRETRKFCAGKKQEDGGVPSTLEKENLSSYIEEHLGDPSLNLCMLAEWLGEPERKLYNDFKSCFGMSFSSYLEQQRISYACEYLKQGMAVKETADKVGYGSDYSFRRAFKRVVGIPPSDFRRMQAE